MDRRAFLGGVIAATLPAVGGCSAIGGDSGDDGPVYPDPPESLAAVDAKFKAVGQPPDERNEQVAIGEESGIPDHRTPPTIRLWSGDEHRTVAVQIAPASGDQHTAFPAGDGDYDCNQAYYSVRVTEDVEVEHLSTQMSCPPLSE